MRFLFPLLIFLVIFFAIRSALRGFIEGARVPASKREDGGTGVKTGRMEKDPVCGMYVDIATSVKATFEGETKYFCSAECMNKYKKAI